MKPYFLDDSCTLYHGRAEEILPAIPKADCLITDPPFELTASGGGIGAQRDYLGDIDGTLDGGFDYSLLESFDNFFCFCGKEQLPEMFKRFSNRQRWMLLTWNKTNPTPLTNCNYLPDTEYIFHSFAPGRLFGKYADKSRFIVFPVEKNNFAHPTVKPIAIMTKLIRLGTQVGELVVDCYAGTGSTLVAAKQEGRKSIGIESNERHCETAASRLSQAMLFSPMPIRTEDKALFPSLPAERKEA